MGNEKIKQLLDILNDNDIDILKDAFEICLSNTAKEIIHIENIISDFENFNYLSNSFKNDLLKMDLKRLKYKYEKCLLTTSLFKYHN